MIRVHQSKSSFCCQASPSKDSDMKTAVSGQRVEPDWGLEAQDILKALLILVL